MNPFFQSILKASPAVRGLVRGLNLTFRHLKKGQKRRGPIGIEDPNYFKDADKAVTIQYPKQQIPVPDVGRYRLHLDAEDCIVCDKCARVCPVDCITIEGIKAVEPLGMTSDGTKKRLYLPVFDIDMAKCCYCGLCTTVCPTECLTMTKVYDYSEYDRDEFVFHFGMMSPEEEAQKREELAKARERAAAEKATKAAAAKKAGPASAKPKAKPSFKPSLPKKKPQSKDPGAEA